jgi:uroporphyrinogen decarboxylase
VREFLRSLARKRMAQEDMGSRDRVLVSLSHREPDRVPIDLWATRQVRERLVRELETGTEEGLLDALGVDFRVIRGPSLVGLELERFPDGSYRDLWGVVRRPVSFGSGESRGTYNEVKFSPLAEMTTVEQIDEHPWPSADWWDYSHVRDDCLAQEGRCVVFAGDRLDRTAQLKTAMYMRGMARIFRDLRSNPEIARAIFKHIVDYFLEYNARVFEAADGLIDIFMMGDDFGTQRGLMMPVPLWREYFEEGFRRFIELAHGFGILVMHHTCGSIRPLIPLFIEDGLDVLQSLQPRAEGMDLAGIKRDFGSRIGLHGSVDIQQTMPRGTPQEVREEVRARMDAGKEGGGYIICTAHNLQVDVPTRNIVELVRAYHDFGSYGVPRSGNWTTAA